MNKSFMERIFPHSPNSVLPQYEYTSSPSRSSTPSEHRISLRGRSNSPASPSGATKTHLKSAPLSATVVHHDDPFLPIERAAKALQRTLQDLINAQSDALESSLPEDHHDDVSSVGSPTPTPSVSSLPKAGLPRTMPIRQPKPKKISLRAARKGLGKTMDEFAHLKKEEILVIQAEAGNRQSAIRKAGELQSKRLGLESEMGIAQNDGSASNPAALRSEAAEMEREIQELEHRLLELRTRHRHLINRAEEHENAIDSKLSSFKHSMEALDRQTRQFLGHPPVRCSLSNYDDTHSTRGGMYALNGDRRTLEMAQEQWSTEQELLEQRTSSAEREGQALQDGAALWRVAVGRINTFEKGLRHRVNSISQPAQNTSTIVQDMDSLIEVLENDYATSEANDWKLLMVAIGAELAALNRARELLVGPSPAEDEAGPESVTHETNSEDGNNPPQDLLNGDLGRSQRLKTEGSNESLKATLEQFSNKPRDKGKTPVRHQMAARNDANDSEDDDGPTADFLLSH